MYWDLLNNPREVTWGRNIVTFKDTKPNTFGHEFGHYIEVMQQSWGTMQMKGIWEQLFIKGDAYVLTGTDETLADELLTNVGGTLSCLLVNQNKQCIKWP
ncbi:MAG: hypothetical protein LBT29_00225 [Flavobacteriaceae bacterium]|jgi:hypothetical protein|nr:hypothetical protein [Flavobacteriaceae bacterium]